MAKKVNNPTREAKVKQARGFCFESMKMTAGRSSQNQ